MSFWPRRPQKLWACDGYVYQLVLQSGVLLCVAMCYMGRVGFFEVTEVSFTTLTGFFEVNDLPLGFFAMRSVFLRVYFGIPVENQ